MELSSCVLVSLSFYPSMCIAATGATRDTLAQNSVLKSCNLDQSPLMSFCFSLIFPDFSFTFDLNFSSLLAFSPDRIAIKAKR